MTYLEIVNSVLRRLREREVASVSESSYSKLIGDFVNDARNEVETAWNWSALRTTLTLTTTADIFNYELNGSQNNFTLIDVINDTNNQFMNYRSSTWFDNAYLNQGSVTGCPVYYNFNGVSTDGDTQVDIYPIPDAVYTIRFNAILRNQDMTGNGTTLYVPSRPVILLALAKAIEERGEDGGNASMNAYAAGRSSLADEIALDAARRPDETIWYPV
tara:strand:+ start:208 stop:855 length:648 start_codon:yes stop_codon:yes gene_type:complete